VSNIPDSQTKWYCKAVPLCSPNS